MNIPQLLILFRLLLGPIILVLAFTLGLEASLWIVILINLGMLSDILDGIIARKQNVSSAKLRRMDSQTDVVFWVSVAVVAWELHSELIRPKLMAIRLMLFTEIMCYVVSWAKFQREQCTHSFLSKTWGMTLLVGFTSLIGFGHAGFPVNLAITMGLISHLDVILITLLLPKWTHDIPSAYHALQIRRGRSIKRNKLLNG